MCFLNGVNANRNDIDNPNQKQIGQNLVRVWNPSVMQCLGATLLIPLCVGHYVQRTKLRRALKQAPQPEVDILGSCLCSCCAACQNSEEVLYETERLSEPNLIDLQVLSRLLTSRRNEYASSNNSPETITAYPTAAHMATIKHQYLP